MTKSEARNKIGTIFCPPRDCFELEFFFVFENFIKVSPLRVSAHHWHVSAFKKTPDNIRRSGVSKYLSLRWHYPNQVLGRNFWFPLSLHHKLPCIWFVTVFYTLCAQIARGHQIRMPSQWSISCWMIWAVQPVKVRMRGLPSAVSYCTLMLFQRLVGRTPSSERQPSSVL